ncbi:hypothetical protein AOLI_G00318260 [Acnodon oligacanthus]
MRLRVPAASVVAILSALNGFTLLRVTGPAHCWRPAEMEEEHGGRRPTNHKTERLSEPAHLPLFLRSTDEEAVFPGVDTNMDVSFTKGKSAILERPLSRPKTEARLADMGQSVGASLLDVLVLREKNGKRETKVLNILLFIKVNVWKALFGKEADKLEQANDDDKTYYIIEKEPLVNAFISVPKENSTLNCAAFTAGIVEAILTHSGFPAKVTAHWHKGTTLMIKFDEAVIAREKQLDGR